MFTLMVVDGSADNQADWCAMFIKPPRQWDVLSAEVWGRTCNAEVRTSAGLNISPIDPIDNAMATSIGFVRTIQYARQPPRKARRHVEVPGCRGCGRLVEP